jgi:hypothetical protein
MLHQRRVPFLLVSRKCSTHWAHLRTRVRSTVANSVAALYASGANKSSRDNPNAEVHFYDTGHFALETHHQEIASANRDFLDRKLASKATAA